jgi:hypothetical protein
MVGPEPTTIKEDLIDAIELANNYKARFGVPLYLPEILYDDLVELCRDHGLEFPAASVAAVKPIPTSSYH